VTGVAGDEVSIELEIEDGFYTQKMGLDDLVSAAFPRL
jgi:hypothetical protein